MCMFVQKMCPCMSLGGSTYHESDSASDQSVGGDDDGRARETGAAVM